MGDELSIAGVHASRVIRASRSGTASDGDDALVVKTFAVDDVSNSSASFDSVMGTSLALKEEKAQRRLSSSPYIIAASSVSFDKNTSRISLISRFADGGSLECLRRRANGGALAPSAICWIALSTARALAFAHSIGVIHANLRPSNILMTLGPWALSSNPTTATATLTTARPSGTTAMIVTLTATSRPSSAPSNTSRSTAINIANSPLYDSITSNQVIDCNISVCDFLTPATLRSRDAAAGGGGGGGSLRAAALYSAPEVLRDPQNYAPESAADVWALGAILWSCATGALLAATALARAALRRGDWTIEEALDAAGSAARDRWEGLPTALRDVIAQCLAIDPRERPSASAVARHDALALGLVAERASVIQLDEIKAALAAALTRAEIAEALADERAIHTASLLRALARAELVLPPIESGGGTGGDSASAAIVAPSSASRISSPSSSRSQQRGVGRGGDNTILRTPRGASRASAMLPPPPLLPADASPEDLVFLLTIHDCVHETFTADVANALRAYAERGENRKNVAIGAGVAPALVAALKMQAASAPAATALSSLARALAEGRGDAKRRSALIAAGAVPALVTSLNMLDFCRNQDPNLLSADAYGKASTSVDEGLRSLGYSSSGVAN